MPTYIFKKKTSKKQWSEMMSIAEMEHYLESNSDVELVPAAPLIATRMTKKPDDGFRDILKNIKKKNPKSTINTW